MNKKRLVDKKPSPGWALEKAEKAINHLREAGDALNAHYPDKDNSLRLVAEPIMRAMNDIANGIVELTEFLEAKG